MNDTPCPSVASSCSVPESKPDANFLKIKQNVKNCFKTKRAGVKYCIH